jgi:hypothetical protein
VITTASPRLVFGVYPGGFVVANDAGAIPAGPPDDPDKINQALDYLQGGADRAFLVRAYRAFTDLGQMDRHSLNETPAGFDRLLVHGRMLDLVAVYHSASGDVEGYCRFLGELIARYGPRISRLQVCEEPNVTDNPILDGYYPRVADAIVTGVTVAKHRARRLGHTHIQVGCNTTPLLGPASGFLAHLVRAGGERFIHDLDYLGLDFFPDVFRPVADVETAAEQLFVHHRGLMTAGGLARVPLIITEHGWPTGPDRPAERQAQVLTGVIRTIDRNVEVLNITGYTHFSLRDQDTRSNSLFHRFGLMTDDYTPKPALHTYRDLIDRHST